MKRLSLFVLPLMLSVLLAACGEKAPADAAATASAPAEAPQVEASAAQGTAEEVYLEGIRIKDSGDYEKAYATLNQAMEMGAPCASFFIGIMYENGEGRSADKAQALDWYKKSYAAGCNEAGKRVKLLQNKK